MARWKVLLPKTKFPIRVNPGNHELAIQKARCFEKLYEWQQKNRPRASVFTLHDGPPYANGNPHMGHVLNKVLKDIINRYKLMKGFRIQYRPGWDCHGLPIEMKACQNMPPGSSAVDIRHTAKLFAGKAIELQKSAFIRWGVIGDWNNPYITMSKEYESHQIDVFYQMYKQGCIYRGYKPVYWSPSSLTALAEAELEYHEHSSNSAYVLYSSNILQLKESYGSEIYSLVWTTTPWTLPANRAICYHPNHTYALIKQLNPARLIVVGAERLEALQGVLGKYELISEFPGTVFANCQYTDLFNEKSLLPFLPADHVSSSEGTGLVHTAPAHGFEDYTIGMKHDLDLTCSVDATGRYKAEAGSELAGLKVLGSGNDAVIDKLRAEGSIIHLTKHVHRYPYDWRSKKPVIIRSTEQWFASVKSLKEEAIRALNGTIGIPSAATTRMIKTLEERNEWCISRQRVWGVPIPVFFSTEGNGEYLMNDESIRHIRDLFRAHGSNSWWSLPVEKLLPPSLSNQAYQYSKGEDTMDVWFDSGSSWASVLPDGVADMYLEGQDQYRGWFQSSLLTSVATQRKSPYQQIVSHGFVLDRDGVKMSKSLGNVTSPSDMINNKGFGADTMRLWVVSGDFTSDMAISMDILKQVNDFLHKVRLSLRFLLGNLSNFDSKSDLVPFSELPPLDQYLLHKLHSYYTVAGESYESLSFSKIYHFLVTFVRKDLSAFYFEIVKDRLYCDARNSTSRLSSLTVLHYILTHLLTTLGPILPHLVEEVAMYYPLEQGNVYNYTSSAVIY